MKSKTTVRTPLLAAACILFYPISKDHLCTVTFGLMYGLYSRAASNQERPMMARVWYMKHHMMKFEPLSVF
jgi:hypothetical protein